MELILSTAYLPPISWIALLLKNRSATIEVYEHFDKQTYRNRCVIYGPNGRQNLTVPIIRHGKTKIKDLQISYAEDWRPLHWRSLVTAYKSRPFFDVLGQDIKHVFDSKPEKLLDLNNRLLQVILNWLQEDVSLNQSRDFVDPNQHIGDYRYSIHPKKDSIVNGFPPYFQQFESKHGFQEDLSVIDLIFSEGRAAWDYLNEAQLRS